MVDFPDSDYGVSTQDNKGAGGIHVGQEQLSSIDYKTQALITLFFGGIGVSDFYAGNYLQGLAKLAVNILTAPFLAGSLVPVIATMSFISLSQGTYADANGKVIRQVVQLKKEEISSCDQRIALILCCYLGWLGVHQFYAGKPLKGVLMVCSLGGLGVWHVINVYQLATCGFKDGQGKTICPDYIKLSTLRLART